MELLSDILSYHQNSSADIPPSSQINHRMAYIGTAAFTIKFLQTVLPPEKVCAFSYSSEGHTPTLFHLKILMLLSPLNRLAAIFKITWQLQFST